MGQTIQKAMRAVAIDQFGDIETLGERTLPVPEIGPDEVLIRRKVHVARTFPLDQAADAYIALEDHYLGKLALRVS